MTEEDNMMAEFNRNLLALIQQNITLFEMRYKNDKKSGKNMLLSTSIDIRNISSLLDYYIGENLLKVSVMDDEGGYEKILVRFIDRLRIYDLVMDILVMEDNDETHHKAIFLLSSSFQPFRDYKIENNEDLFLNLFRKEYRLYLRPSMRDGTYGIEGISIVHCNNSLDIYSIVMAIYHTLLEYVIFERKAKETLEKAVSKGLLERR